MILSLAAAGGILSAMAQSHISTDQLPNLFVSACLDGSVRLNGRDATPLSFEALPSGLRSRLGKPREAKVWKVGVDSEAYLYLLDYDGSQTDPKVCGLAAESLALGSASAAIDLRVRGHRSPGVSARSTEWLKPEDGYKVLATRTGGFTILQVNWLADQQGVEAPITR